MAQANGFKVTPWEVRGAVDYTQLAREFGVNPISQEQKTALSKGDKPHFMLRRDIFYTQRDLPAWLAQAAKGKPVALYTGRGPSGNTHLGHMLPWVFTKWLQDKFDCPLYFQITDDEKFMFKDDLTRAASLNFALENSLDIIATGFAQGKTHLLIDSQCAGRMYPLATEVAKRVTLSTAKATFGFTESTNIGSIFFTSMQSVPAMLPTIDAREKGLIGPKESVPVLIPCAIDQDPHFRLTRDVIEKIGFPKPSTILSKFLPSLKGGDKMSASDPESSIYTTDTPEVAAKKVSRAFTGGRSTVEEQRKLGGNPDICSVCQYLKYFFEPDDALLQERLEAYRRGEILDGENKAYLTGKVTAFLKEHQRKREQARKVLDKFLVK
jgi:tryptophanyl-tRNA synthetase